MMSTTRSATAFRAALYLYPPEFRREFAGEMLRDFDEASTEAWDAGRWRALVALWASVCADLATTILVEWLSNGRLAFVVLPVISAAVIFAAAFANIARILGHAAVRAPAMPADRDLLLLLFLAMSVLLIVTATLVFNLWFMRLNRARQRRI